MMNASQLIRIANLEHNAKAFCWTQDFYDGVRIALAREPRPVVAMGHEMRAGWLRGIAMRMRDCTILPRS